MWFGLQPPDGVEIAWGARAIIEEYPSGTYRFSLLGDRQQAQGESGPLLRWLDQHLLGKNGKLAQALTKPYGGAWYELTNPRSRVRVGYDDGEFHFRVCPNASYGYLFMIAWIGETTDEGSYLPLVGETN